MKFALTCLGIEMIVRMTAARCGASSLGDEAQIEPRHLRVAVRHRRARQQRR